MWQKIANELQMPWRAAESMHWQIGEIDMAQRANVPLFHIAGQQPSRGGVMVERVPSASPTLGNENLECDFRGADQPEDGQSNA